MWLWPSGRVGSSAHSPTVITLDHARPNTIWAIRKAAQSRRMSGGSLPGAGRASCQLYQAQVMAASSIQPSPGTSCKAISSCHCPRVSTSATPASDRPDPSIARREIATP